MIRSERVYVKGHETARLSSNTNRSSGTGTYCKSGSHTHSTSLCTAYGLGIYIILELNMHQAMYVTLNTVCEAYDWLAKKDFVTYK